MLQSRPLILALCTALLAGCSQQPVSQPAPAPAAADPTQETMSFHALKAESLEGDPVDLADYRDTVALVVNVASECGYTRQYAGLQSLHDELKGRGFAVLGFPSNDFGGQEPGSAEQIRTFCTSKFGVDFPMFAKVRTRPGEGQSPVYALLGEQAGELPSWNFGKYLVGKDGQVIAYFGSGTAPDDAELRAKIEAAL